MSNKKINWLAIKEPLRGICQINSVDGIMDIKMHEAQEGELDHILETWQEPSRPMKSKKTPVEKDGKQTFDTTYVPDEDPKILGKWQEEMAKISELQAVAYAEACIDEECKPEGATAKERVAVLMQMPRAVRVKLVNFAQSLGDKRLAERVEEAKKS